MLIECKNITDTSNLILPFNQGEPMIFSFHYPSDDCRRMLNSFIIKIFSRNDRLYLRDIYISVLRELIENAVKANAKRLFYQQQGLDITNPDDYQKGVQSFRDVAYNLSSMREALTASSYTVTVTLQKRDGGMAMKVRNNARPVPYEVERIQVRVREAARCAHFNEVYDLLADSTEGAGLGIVLIVFLQKNAGINSDFLDIDLNRDSITMSVFIPDEIRDKGAADAIKQRIMDEVESLPPLPEHIVELQSLCADPLASIADVASKIRLDPALTTDLFKIANSAGFISRRKVKQVEDAVMIIGLRNLNNIVAAAAAREILNAHYNKFRKLWKHSSITGRLSSEIAASFGLDGIRESVYVAGLLHDIGKIVLLSVDPQLLTRISDIVGSGKLRKSTILEEIAIGISHSSIGALMAEKWNFHEELIEVIKYHHSPLQASPEYRDTLMVVYLANLFSNIQPKRLDPAFFETEVLERFHLTDRDTLVNFYHQILDRAG